MPGQAKIFKNLLTIPEGETVEARPEGAKKGRKARSASRHARDRDGGGIEDELDHVASDT